MRKVISNTTPILALLKIGKLYLLQKIYGQIIIPFAVYTEIENGKNGIYYTDLKQFEWIKIANINNIEAKKHLFDLDEGEAEVIVLAEEENADLVILDEAMGRRYAQMLNLKITGTIGILLKAKQLGFIENIKPLLLELKSKGVWLNQSLIEKTVEIAEEK